MRGLLPHGAIVAQKKARTNPELKELMYKTLKELSVLNAHEQIQYARKQIDFYLKQLPHQEISCQKGCAHCCHHLIHASSEEANSLGTTKFPLRLKAQKEILNDHLPWTELKKEDRRCVFLDENNQCGVYPNRPLVCRTTYVSSPADNCDLDKNLPITPTLQDQAYIILLAYYNLNENSPLPLLLKNL